MCSFRRDEALVPDAQAQKTGSVLLPHGWVARRDIECSQMEFGSLEPDVSGQTETGVFGISPHFSDSINRNVVESEILGE